MSRGLGDVYKRQTMLCLKKLAPTRLVKNSLYERIAEAESRGAGTDELREIMGRAASKRGIFEGDIETGELEIGQIASAVDEIRPVSLIMKQLLREYREAYGQLYAWPDTIN